MPSLKSQEKIINFRNVRKILKLKKMINEFSRSNLNKNSFIKNIMEYSEADQKLLSKKKLKITEISLI